MPARNTVLNAAVVSLGAVALVLLTVGVVTGATDPRDSAVIHVIRDPAWHDALAPLRYVTALASTLAVAAVGVGAVLFGRAVGQPRRGLEAALTILLALLANTLFKLAIARSRPELLEPLVTEDGYSFPSGHTAVGTVTYGVLAVLVARSRLAAPVRAAAVAALACLVLLIGMSRIWLGVHYPTDVLAGFVLGGMVVTGYAWHSRRRAAAGGLAPDPAGRPR
jgi:undecaprenyl-diphosphatase